MLDFFKNKIALYKKSRHEKSLLKKNGCVCYCSRCTSIINNNEHTEYEGIYKHKCSQCSHVGYFDYCHPAPIYIDKDDLNKWVKGWNVPKRKLNT